MKQLLVYNTSKSRLETIQVKFTDNNTTWFDEALSDQDIHMITDAFNGLLISKAGYEYPIFIDGMTRADIAYDRDKAMKLIRSYTEVE